MIVIGFASAFGYLMTLMQVPAKATGLLLAVSESRYVILIMINFMLLILGTFLLSMLLYVDRVCISSAEAAVTKDLGLSGTEFSWIMSAFALGYALCQTPSGILADRLGPRRVCRPRKTHAGGCRRARRAGG